MISRLFFLLALPVLSYCQAQGPEEQLADWGKRSPIEKIHLHLDRENYLAGETAWFKAYLYSDYLPDTISTIVYIELMKDSSEVLGRKILPVLFGTTNGQMEIPDSLTTGNYILRAWTPTMLNHDPDFIYSQSLFIYGKKKDAAKPGTTVDKIRLEFFPEGGNLVTGLSGTVAFKATNQHGWPITVKGKIYNENNEQVANLISIHDGMGMFDLTPAPGQRYYVILDNDPHVHKYYLPGSGKNGISLSIIPHPQGNFFEIRQSPTDPLYQAAYIVGQMQHRLVFRQDLRSMKEEIQGVINTRHLHSGILHVTVFNKEGMPLAERLTFVNNKEYIQRAELITDTIDLSAKGRNHFNIKLKDTIRGSFSVSVNDAEYDLLPMRSANIYSRFLLSSDLKGDIHEPSYYFSGDNDTIRTALDLVMMTNGWRRFSWKAIPKNSSLEFKKDPGFINLAGKVTLRDVKKPFDSKKILLYIVGTDSARNILTTSTDKNGNFQIDSLLFFGSARILFSDTRGKKNQYIDVHLSPDSLGSKFLVWPFRPIAGFKPGSVNTTTGIKMSQDYDEIVRAKGILLGNVTVKSKKKTPLQELEERYASGMFSGMSEKTYDLTNNPPVSGHENIFEYLRTLVPGLDVGTNDNPQSPEYGNYVVFYRQGPSASSMGPIPMTIYLNEISTDANVISNISASDVAMVKVYSSFVGAVGNGAGGAMAIYTKKGTDLFGTSTAKGEQLKYNGFSVIREFYSPDYKKEPALSRPDTRITLQWKPDIMVSGVDPKIPVIFYNNERTKRIRVVVEGMTVEGKMVMIEKIF